MSDYEFHPVANIFPLMEGDSFDAFVEDIRKNGLQQEIYLHDDKIIDGRNRDRACKKAGITPRYREWNGEGSLIDFVVSLNLHRRHLNESQRAMVAGRIANLPRGGKLYAMSKSCSEVSSDTSLQESDNSKNTPTRIEAGKLLNVGETSVARAHKTLRHGTPELIEAVDRGQVSVAAAAAVSELPKDIQSELVRLGPTSVVKEAQKIYKKTNGHPTVFQIRSAATAESIIRLAGELRELSSRPQHRYPFLQLKQKAEELNTIVTKAFGGK